MKRFRPRRPRCLIALVWLLLCGTSLAGPDRQAQDLVDLGDLQLRSWLNPAQDIVVGQQVKLTIEVATRDWFTGGTRVRIPEVPDLVILQTESFAANASESRNGETWVIQRWSLDIYARQSGVFRVGPIPLDVSVSDGAGGTLTGRVQSPSVRFEASVPPDLEGVGHWVAAPSFRVTQRFDRNLEDLTVGDAFEQVVRFEAEDQMAMMLPQFEPAKATGLAVYPRPPELTNRSNRGTLIASREEHISYLVEDTGDYLLPAMDFFWWDTRSQALVLRSLPATSFTVGSTEVTRPEPQAPELDRRQILIALMATVAIMVLLLSIRYIPLCRLWLSILAVLQTLTLAVRRWRRPGLPPSLNPDSNAGD